MRSTAHNITDVGLGFVEPVWALNVEADGVTPVPIRDPVRGGIGRITRFDGTAWLQDRDTQLQISLLEPALVGAPHHAVLRRERPGSHPTEQPLDPAGRHPLRPGRQPRRPPFPGLPDSDTAHNGEQPRPRPGTRRCRRRRTRCATSSSRPATPRSRTGPTCSSCSCSTTGRQPVPLRPGDRPPGPEHRPPVVLQGPRPARPARGGHDHEERDQSRCAAKRRTFTTSHGRDS